MRALRRRAPTLGAVLPRLWRSRPDHIAPKDQGAAMTAPAPSFCPHCGAQVVPGARFCASCGLDLAAAASGAPVMAPQPGVAAPLPVARPAGGTNGPALGMIAGGIIVIVGSFLPWLTATAAFVGTINRNGIDGGGDGIFT